MKQLALLTLIVFTLSSCTNIKSNKVDVSASQSEGLKQKSIANLKGVWVLTEYIDEIEKTKSPLKSADKLKGVVSMIIDGSIKDNGMEVVTSWNNHEGFSFITYLEAGHTENSLKTNIPDYEDKSNYYEIGYETINNEIFSFIYHYDKENKLLDKKQFTKVAETQKDNDVSAALQQVVNEKIFAGNYTLVDNNNLKTQISLKSDGTLIGSSSFKTYFVYTDFLGGPDSNLDQLCFNLSEPDSKCYAFEIKDKTVYLYNTHSDEAKGILILDKLQYKLERISEAP